MSYILILRPDATNGWPAVVGGYATSEEATVAGRIATMADVEEQMRREDKDPWEMGDEFRKRTWVAFTVIPGSASAPP